MVRVRCARSRAPSMSLVRSSSCGIRWEKGLKVINMLVNATQKKCFQGRNLQTNVENQPNFADFLQPDLQASIIQTSSRAQALE